MRGRGGATYHDARDGEARGREGQAMTGGFAVGRERAFAEVGRISAAGLDGPELLRRTAKALRRAVPFDAFCASTLDPATNLLTHGIAEGMDEGSGVEAGTFFDHVYFEEDLHQTRAMVREGRPVQLLSRSTGGKLDRSLRYRELLRPLGFAHELGSVFADGGAWGGMDLIRGADVPDFTAREVALVRRIAPHVGAGLKAAALRSRADARRGNPEAPGVLNLDREGSIASLTPAAERWLGYLEDLHPGWRAGPTPIPVRMGAGSRSTPPAPSPPTAAPAGRSSLSSLRGPRTSPGSTWHRTASRPVKRRWSGSSPAGARPTRSRRRSSSPSTRSSGISRTPSRRSA